MKLSMVISALFLACVASAVAASMDEEMDMLGLRRNRNKRSRGNNARTDYEANCGEYGKFRLLLKANGREIVETSLQNLDSLPIPPGGDTLSYHLHVSWTHEHDDYETGEACGASATGGHYDPAPSACGPASQAKAASPAGIGCDPAGYNCNPSHPQGCERGDLSGKYGKLTVTHGEVENIRHRDFDVPALVKDFKKDNKNQVPGKFSSVVFHDGDSGARLLCCKLEKL